MQMGYAFEFAIYHHICQWLFWTKVGKRNDIKQNRLTRTQGEYGWHHICVCVAKSKSVFTAASIPYILKNLNAKRAKASQ